MNISESKNKTRKRLEQREADILEAATGLFAADGFHATSTRKIAAAAGVSEGTVFHYFNTKNALLLAILDAFYEELIESAGECVQQTMDTRERLLLLARNHLRALLENQAIMMRLIQVYLSVDVNYYLDYKNSHIHQLNYRYTRIFDQVIREGVERGYLDPELKLSALRDLFFWRAGIRHAYPVRQEKHRSNRRLRRGYRGATLAEHAGRRRLQRDDPEPLAAVGGGLPAGGEAGQKAGEGSPLGAAFSARSSRRRPRTQSR